METKRGISLVKNGGGVQKLSAAEKRKRMLEAGAKYALVDLTNFVCLQPSKLAQSFYFFYSH